jgi:hypothetical protein
MKRILILLAAAVLATPTAASAKGPASASIDGPGTGGGINLTGGGENVGTPLGDLAHYGGFFPAVLGQTPDPMSDDRPKGDLGPKYTVTYSVPMGEEEVEIRQDLYPYANPPVTYTEPGQKVYEGMKTRGGWYTAGIPALRVRLIEAGLPSTPPAGRSSTDGGALVSTGMLLAIAAAMGLLLTGTAVFLRRRTRPAAAA